MKAELKNGTIIEVEAEKFSERCFIEKIKSLPLNGLNAKAVLMYEENKLAFYFTVTDENEKIVTINSSNQSIKGDTSE